MVQSSKVAIVVFDLNMVAWKVVNKLTRVQVYDGDAGGADAKVTT